jgi:hypothetical protein
MGTFAPDLEYFVRLAPGSGWGHTLPGAFGMSLPAGLGALWIFHRLVKVPFVYLLPDSVRARLTPQLAPFRFLPLSRLLNIIASLLIGIATHLLWDGVTHDRAWIGSHLTWLHHAYHVRGVGWFLMFDILQIGSSLAGLAIVASWCMSWYRRTEPDPQTPANPVTPHQKHVIVAMGVVVAAVVASLRAWLGVGMPANLMQTDEFVGQMIVTFGALVWWQLALWGVVGPFRKSRRHASEEETYMASRHELSP